MKARFLLNFASCWRFVRQDLTWKSVMQLSGRMLQQNPTENDKSLPYGGAKELGQVPWLPRCSISRNHT